MDKSTGKKIYEDFVGKFVVVCARCGRGFPLPPSNEALIDTMPVWWTQTEEGPQCGGRLMRVDRLKEIERLHALEIVPADEVYILPAGDD